MTEIRKKFHLFSVLGCLAGPAILLAVFVGAPSADIVSPFNTGERLIYDISWYGVSGGSAVMELKETSYQDRPAYHITSTAKSNAFISILYPVNDYVETFVDRTDLVPFRMRSKLQEGHYRADREILFDREKNMATFINYRKERDRKSFDVTPLTQDPLSVLYYFRTLLPLEVGETAEMDVFDGNKNWKFAVQVIAKEKVSIPAGDFDTLKTRASIRYKGIFVNKGDVTIWFTNDEKRIPVLMESKIKIGRITATLMELERQ